MHTLIPTKQQKPSLYKYTDWDAFREILDESIDTQIPLKSTTHIEEAIATLTNRIQQAVWLATPPLRSRQRTDRCPQCIQQNLTDKRKARRRWQITCAPEAKQTYNKLAKEHLLNTHNNTSIQQYRENLSPHKDTNYSLRKTTRKLKQPQYHIPPLRLHNTWARTDEQNATTFAHHLSTVFRPFPSQASSDEEEDQILQELSSPHQMALPLTKIGISEVQYIIQHKINPTKAPGYDLITGTVLQELSQKGIRALTQIYDAIRLEYFP
jgi:hypothetical protein